jgi:hypothetical protein
LGDALARVLRDKLAMIVASTDLSHFYPYDTAVRLDKVFLEDVEKYDPEGLFHDIRARKCEACGGGPVVAVMFAARGLGANRAKILKYANSGDVTGDRSQVVGYLRSIRLRLPRFTIIGATTRLALMTSPLRARFGVIYRLDFYDQEAMEKIVRRSANILKVEIDEEGCKEIGARYGVEFHFEDFRRGWSERGRLASEHGLYRQRYCGCIFSEWERYNRERIDVLL